MKKVLAALTAAVVVISSAGCDLPFGKGSDSSSSSSTSSSSSSSTFSKPSSGSTDSENTDKNESVPEETSIPEETSVPEESSSVPEKTSVPEESSSVPEETSVPEESPSESGGILDSIVDKLSFESIYNDYAEQMETVTAEYINKINSGESDIDLLAEYCDEGVEKLAELLDEGVEKMADIVLVNAVGYGEWSTKLSSLYMTKSGEITSAYMDASVSGALGGLDFDFDLGL